MDISAKKFKKKKIMTKYLINLDGYLRESLSNALSSFNEKIDYSFFCATKKDKLFLLRDFPKSNVYCWEEFVANNSANKIEINEISRVEKEIGIPLMQVNASMVNYAQFYKTTSLDQETRNFVDLKRSYLNFLFYSEILKKELPDVILHEHAGGAGSEVLERLSDKKKIKYYIFCTRFFENRFLLMDIKGSKFEALDNFYAKCSPSKKELKAVHNIFLKIEKNISPAEVVHIKNVNKKKNNKVSNYWNKLKDFNSRSLEQNYILSKYPPISDYILERIKSKFREFYVENMCSKTINQIMSDNPNKKIVTYFLQSEPELIIYKLGGKVFSDQKTIIKNLAFNLPSDFILLVKEHKSQSINSRYRNLQFFKDITNLTNVRLVKSQEDPIKLINCSFAVANLSGTIGLEALIRNKPIILFGDVFYQNFQNILKIKHLEDLENIIEKIIIRKKSMNQNDCLKFIYALRKTMFKGNVFDGAYLTKNNDLFLKESLKKIFSTYN